ncbi:hypothetical protein [Amphritea balenae]|nr:hypothetical protein [Amphritea balenae]GGK75694.1 hypothetical protein GCM10007941_27310 [Amphritea balenae]
MSSCCGGCGGQDAEELKKQEQAQEQEKAAEGQVQQQEATEQE